jgi:hypothetical protein
MRHSTHSDQLAKLLSKAVLDAIEGGHYSDYLLRVYKHLDRTPSAIPQVHVVEVDGIDIQSGRLSSIPIQWWRIDKSGAERIEAPDMGPFNSASELGRTLYPNPIVKFFVEWPKVLYAESVGPMMRRRMIFTVQFVDNVPQIVDETLLWLANYPDQVMIGSVR